MVQNFYMSHVISLNQSQNQIPLVQSIDICQSHVTLFQPVARGLGFGPQR